MLAQRQADVAVALDDVVAFRHLAQFDLRLLLLGNDGCLALGGGREKRKRFVAQRLYSPQRIAAFEVQ